MVSAPLFITKQENNQYLLAVGFKNTGGLDESAEVQGTITDTFKKVITLAPQTKIVGPDGYGDVRYQIPALPWYQLWFDVDLTIKHNAMSEFRTEFITEKLLAPTTLTVHKTFFLFPWWLVAVLILLALLLTWIRHMLHKAHQRHLQAEQERKELEELKKWKEEHKQE